MQEEKSEPELEKADVVGGYFDGSYMAVVHYKGEVFGIKETNERQLLGQIEIAVNKRNEANDLHRSSTDD